MSDSIIQKISILFVWVTTFFAPTRDYMFFIGALVMLDTGIGVYAAMRRGRYVTHKLFNVIVKIIYYFSAILLSHWAENLFELGLTLKITAGYIAFIEISSIDENYYKITGKRLFKEILDKIKR